MKKYQHPPSSWRTPKSKASNHEQNYDPGRTRPRSPYSERRGTITPSPSSDDRDNALREKASASLSRDFDGDGDDSNHDSDGGDDVVSNRPQQHGLAASNSSDAADGNGPLSSMAKLRAELAESADRYAEARAALADRDDTLSDLRREVRDKKATVARLEGENELLKRRVDEHGADIVRLGGELTAARETVQEQQRDVQKFRNIVDGKMTRDEVLGELQVKLDRAEGRLLTEEMRRKGMEEDHAAEVESLRAQIRDGGSKTTRKIDDLTREVEEKDEAIESLEDTVRQLQSELERTATSAPSSRGNVTALNAQLALVNRRLEEFGKEIDVREEMLQLQSEEMAEKEQDHTEEVQRLQSEIEDLRQKVDDGNNDGEVYELTQILEERERRLAASERSVEDLEQSVFEYRTQLEEAQEERSSIEALRKENAEANEELKDLRERIDVIDGERDELQRCLDDAMKELEMADTEVQAVHELYVERDRLMKQVDALGKKLDERNEEVLELRSRCETDDERSRDSTLSGKSASSAISARARAKVMEDRFRAQMEQVIRSGEEKKDLDESGVPRVVNGPGVEYEMESLHFKLRSTEDTLKATQRELHELKIRESQPVGEPNGDEAKALHRALVEAKEEISRLEVQLSVAKGDLKAQEESGAELRKSLKEAVALLTPLKAHVLVAERDKEKANMELSSALERIKSLESELNDRSTISRMHDEDIEVVTNRLQASLTERDEEVSRLQSEVERLEAVLGETREELQASKKGISEANGQATGTSTTSSPMRGRSLRMVQKDLRKKDELIDQLRDEVKRLRDNLQELQSASVSHVEAPSPSSRAEPATRSIQSSSEEDDTKLRQAEAELEKARDDLRVRRKAERTLKQLLSDSQTKLQRLTKEHAKLKEEKETLVDRLKESQRQMVLLRRMRGGSSDDVALQNIDLTESATAANRQVKDLEDAICKRDDEILQLKEKLQQTQLCLSSLGITDVTDIDENHVKLRERELEELRTAVQEANSRATALESELSVAKEDLTAKKDSEKVLNKSLKEALGLIKPLQRHVQAAEEEKEDLELKLQRSRERIIALEKETVSLSSKEQALASEGELASQKEKDALKQMVTRLREEKVELEKALNELQHSAGERQMIYDRDKLRKLEEELVEVKSRYEVTKKMLDESADTNMSLFEDLREMEDEEKETGEEIKILKEKLRVAQQDLANAKYIATTALVKVEEMNEERSLSRSFSQDTTGDGSKFPSRASDDDQPYDIQLHELRKEVASLQGKVQMARERNEELEHSLQEKDELLSKYTVDVGDASVAGEISQLSFDDKSRSPRQKRSPRYLG